MSRITRGLVVASLVVGGLTGGLLDRALVATPAWEHLGAQAWAAYSRRADLGNGLFVYPIAYIGWSLLAVAAALSFRLDRAAPRAAALPIYLSALCMLAGMATTLKAAPIMLGVGRLGDDDAGLQSAFDEFTLWGVHVRGAFFTLAFLSAVWALVRLYRRGAPVPVGATGPPDREA